MPAGHDQHVPFENAQFVHAGIARSSLVRFENSGHAPHLEEPEKFTRTLSAFADEDLTMEPTREGARACGSE